MHPAYAAHPTQDYYGMQYPQQPVRTGYEKYRSEEPMPDLNVDRSIWGMGPSKAFAQAQQGRAQEAEEPLAAPDDA